MIDTHRLAAFALAAFAIIVIPGPSVLFVIGRGVALGRRAAIVTVVGNAMGAYLVALVVAAGLGPLLSRSVVLLTAVKLAGAAYLVWLGVSAIRHRKDLADALDLAQAPQPTRTILRQGFMVGLLNPKIAIFFAAVLPQFVNPSLGHLPVQMALLGLVFVLIALVSDSMWGLAAGTARQWFAADRRRLSAMGAIGGSLIIAVGLRLALASTE